MSKMIEIKNLSKKYDNLQVLDNISFDIEKGDVIAVIGPSGQGKTTLLRCINFLTKADSGEMIFDGEHYDLKNISKKDILKLRMKTAFVFQQFNLFRNKTVLDNVTEGLIVARNYSKEKAQEIAKAALSKVGVLDKINNYPSELSGGQQQRVAIARAIATSPEVIYFDEPTSALDPELINEVLEVIQELAKEKTTMVIVTHELNFASKIANRIIFIDDTHIIANTTAKEFFENQTQDRIKNFINSLMRREK